MKVADSLQHKLTEHRIYTREHLVDMPEITDWHGTGDFSDPIRPPPSLSASKQTFTNA